MSLQQVRVPFQTTLNFGVGVDSNTMSPKGMVVQGATKLVEQAAGAVAGFEITQIESMHELEKHLDIQVNASYGAPSFGAGVEGRFSFAASSKVHVNSLFMAITAKVTLPTPSIADPSLTEKAAAMVDNPLAFGPRFGDLFVRAIGRGGLFVAVLKIDTRNEENAKTISAKLSGGYGMFSGKAETNLTQIQTDFRTEISLKVYHEGGPVDLFPKDISDPVQLVQLLKTWLKSFADNPDLVAVPYFAELSPVVIAHGPLPLNTAQSEHAQAVLVRCAKLRSAAVDNLNLMDAIMREPQRYTFTAPVTLADVKAAVNGYEADLDTIAATASAAMNHPASAVLPSDFASRQGLEFPKGKIPLPLPQLDKGPIALSAARGRMLASQDALLTNLRELEFEGPSRTGFEVGLAIDEAGTLQGPGKEKFKKEHEADFDPGAYQRAVDFTIDRNFTGILGDLGERVVEANPAVKAARSQIPVSNARLGFHVAAGQFGSAADGGNADKDLAGGSQVIRDRLSSSVRPGFDAAVAFFKPL